MTQVREEEKGLQVSVGFKASVDAELRGTLDETGKELLCVSDEDSNGNCHASLTSSAKGSTSDRVQSVVNVG